MMLRYKINSLEKYMRVLEEQFTYRTRLFPLTRLNSNDISNILRACLNNQLDSILGISPFYHP